jgi:hypothetical protein
MSGQVEEVGVAVEPKSLARPVCASQGCRHWRTVFQLSVTAWRLMGRLAAEEGTAVRSRVGWA